MRKIWATVRNLGRVCAAASAVSCVVTFTILSAEVAFGRAGGGGSFGGGGGGGGGGSGGGSGGGGDLIALLIWLCIHQPLIGYPLTIALIALIVFGGVKGKQHQVTRAIRRGVRRQAEDRRRSALSRITSSDPQFELEALLKRTSLAFTKIQHAWSSQDLSGVRPFVSDGIFERFTLQIRMQQAEGYRNLMEDVNVLERETVAVAADESFHTVHVKFRAEAVDTNVSLKTGRRISGATWPTEFTEVWSFHRRPGAASLSGEGAIEGRCPQCSATLRIVDVAKCDACGSQVNSGEFDWVLAEITQAGEWNPPLDTFEVPGLASIRARDPGLSIQHLEDRASVVFWRLRAAEFHDQLDTAVPVISPRYRDDFQRSLADMSSRNQFWKDPAIGQVTVFDAEPGDPGGLDMIRVKVRWSGRLCERNGRLREVRSQAIYTHLFVFKRQVGVRSVSQSTFSSAGCPSCGAPVDVNRSGDCKFCGARIVDGRFDWVLDEIQPFVGATAFRAVREPAATSDVMAGGDTFDIPLALSVMAKVVQSDGTVTNDERKALHQFGGLRGLSPDAVDRMIAQSAGDTSEIPVPENPREVTAHLEQIVRAALADGTITRPEKRLLVHYAERSGLAMADVKMAVTRERRRAYRAARAALRPDRGRRASSD